MSTTINPDDAISAEPAITESRFGPSDTSDSASDVVGTVAADTDSDSQATGERPSVDPRIADEGPSDIEPNRVIRLSGGTDDEEDEEEEGTDPYRESETDTAD